MWNFNSPRIVFGEGALDVLDELQGNRALIVTDAVVVRLGLVDLVKGHLDKAGVEVHVFDEVEPEPSVATVLRGAEVARKVGPDWIVGVGGGSSMDAAKAVWVLYEYPDMEPGAISPIMELKLRQKARMVAIPTTSGTGSEVTWGIVITDTEEHRKMGLGHPENLADIAIVDPVMAAGMPPQLTADTGLDALTHAVEGYTCTWRNDITDGLCLVAARLVFEYLPRAVADGADMEARERMHNAATCGGLGFGNAMASMAHALGHTLGGIFHVPHGRAVGLFLPYTIEFVAREAPERYAEMAAFTGCSTEGGEAAARALAGSIRDLCREVGCPTSVGEAGIGRDSFDAQMDTLADYAMNDTQMLTASRCPSDEELRRLFEYAYEGKPVDF
jgi:alcohol dehydrogenase class IV